MAPLIRGRAGKVVSAAVGAAYVGVALLASRTTAFDFFFNSLRELVPVLCVVWGALTLGWHRQEGRRRQHELLALLVLVLAFTTLVQFPFGSWIYFLYVLPLAALAGVAFLGAYGLLRETLLLVVLVAYLVAGMRYMTPGAAGLGDALTGRYPGLAHVDAARGRIYVPVAEADHYRQISRLLSVHAKNGYTFAGPDAPEVYYLADLQNGTPMIYDFLTPPQDRDRLVLAALARHHITAIVVNKTPSFSPTLDQALLDRLDVPCTGASAGRPLRRPGGGRDQAAVGSERRLPRVAAAVRAAEVRARRPFSQNADVQACSNVGCGPGTNAGQFIDVRYVGVDLNPAYIRSASRRYGDRFVVGDAAAGLPDRGAP